MWDQAEADLSCNHTHNYPCLERGMAASWRAGLGGSDAVPVVVIQLPGYDGDCKTLVRTNGPEWDFCNQLVNMRLQQEAGVAADPMAAAVATYDLSCPGCPYGSVHNTHKQSVGTRVAAMLRRLWYGNNETVVEGPRAYNAVLVRTAQVQVSFKGGAAPFYQAGTRNCTVCCNSSAGGAIDFDASADGITWTNATSVTDKSQGLFQTLSFTFPASRYVGAEAGAGDGAGDGAATLRVAPDRPQAGPPLKYLRYTAAAGAFPQCALYNKEGLPALPFNIVIN